MDFKNNAGLIVFFIFIAALAVRILYMFQILQFPLTEYLVKSSVFDQYTYNTSAIKILSGNWIGSEVFGKEPLYPYFLAVIYKIFGYSHVPVYIIQVLLSSLGALCLYKITAAIFNRMAGYIAGFIFAFYSLSVYHDALILRESLIASLAIFLLYFIMKAEDENRLWQWFLSGAMLGFLMLTRRNMLLPFILFYMLLIKKPFKSAFRYALIFTAGFFIVILPVVIRNYVVSDCKYIGISKEVNAFWVGNNPASSGVDVDWSREYNYLNDKAGGNINKTAAVFLNELKNNPGAYASLYLRKIWMFFNGYEAPSNTSYYLYREEFPTLLRWPLFNFQFVCALALIGIFLNLFVKPKPHILYIFLFVLSISVILFHIQDRFRLPVVPFFIIFASYPFYFIIEKIRKREYVKPLAVIITFLFLFIVLKPDLTYGGFRPEQDRIRPVDRTNLALAYMDEYTRRPDPDILEKALKQCDIALKTDNSPSIPHAIKG
ncbi:MAG: glycosyltransferase family 39 protein, partial [Candidatus Omnitrophota bacterium]|nr:glycosyltransferase family 39 protein [Candidatus Omnitrophota bacterium]